MAYGLRIDGLPEMRAAFAKLDPVVKEAMADAVDATVRAIANQAAMRLTAGHGVQTGQMRRALGHTVNRKTGHGRVGLRRGFELAIAGTGGSALRRKGARLHSPTKIGHLVEFGHGGPHPAGPHPFMRPAVASEQAAFLDRCQRAGKVIEQQMAVSIPGGRFL